MKKDEESFEIVEEINQELSSISISAPNPPINIINKNKKKQNYQNNINSLE